MTEAVIQQETAYVFLNRTDQKLPLDGEESTSISTNTSGVADWKSFFKHPPSNLRFKRGSTGSNRDSKRLVKIPCSTPCPSYTDLTIPPPPPKSNSNCKLSAAPVPPAARKKDVSIYPETALLKLHDHRGSTGSNTSGSMSASPTSQDGSCSSANGGLGVMLDIEHDDAIVQEEGGEKEYFGECCMCDLPIYGDDSGCEALDKVFHNSCFKCQLCEQNLVMENFYLVEGKILCRKDYLATLDKCHLCNQPIDDQIVWAEERPYHISCFKCADCGMCLDGIPFVTDLSHKIYCVPDYHRTFAPRCQSCEEPILPNADELDSKRLIAMNMNFHVGCYRCVECGISLVSGADEPPQCFPIDQYPLCIDCNKVWSLRRYSSNQTSSPEVNKQNSLSVS